MPSVQQAVSHLLCSPRSEHPNAGVFEKRPEDKVWDLVAAAKVQNYLPYIPLHKVVNHLEGSTKTKKIRKDDDEVEHEAMVAVDKPPRGLWGVQRRLEFPCYCRRLGMGPTRRSYSMRRRYS